MRSISRVGKNLYIDVTQVPRRFYGQVTYSDKKQAYLFVENDAIVPIENSMYVTYPNSMKRWLHYDQKMKQFQQISICDCALTMRHLLCQDAIFHRITSTTCSELQI